MVVLVIALAGAGAAGFKGYSIFSELNTAEAKMAREFAKAFAGPFNEVERVVYATYIMMAGAVLGIIGGLLVLNGKNVLAGIILLLVGVLPGILVVTAKLPGDKVAEVFIWCGGLIAAGLLAFFAPKEPATTGSAAV
jgi:hypothetical protein